MISTPSRLALGLAATVVSFSVSAPVDAQTQPTVQLVDVEQRRLPGAVDSNSPGIWSRDRSTYIAFTSFDGWASRSTGPSPTGLGVPTPVVFDVDPVGGAWMEAVVRDEQGVLYGYYHSEAIVPECPSERRVPRIGSARSLDEGATWHDLGTVWESSEPTVCDTSNPYIAGGVGDFSVMLDANRQFLYLFYSAYGQDLTGQGVAVARMGWSDRTAPVGAFAVWRDTRWQFPAREVSPGRFGWVYPTGTPILRAVSSWHSADGVTDAFWGPSIHWNTYLGRYVMLLNRSSSVAFEQDGVYISYATTLDNPSTWTTPEQILSGGWWYPQVIGLEPGAGSDKEAGRSARLFMAGVSDYEIEFDARSPPPPPPPPPAPAPPGNFRFLRE